MTDCLVHPVQLSGIVTPPPSKSDAHRALIAATLAGDPSRVQHLPVPRSDDIQATEQCLCQLMPAAKPDEGQPDLTLDCHESGTTLRLLIPLAAALGRSAVFTGHGRLPLRPLADYDRILSPHGIRLVFPQAEGHYLPLRISGRLQPGRFMVPGHISSQYISGLLFALPLLEGDSVIELTSPLASAPYVEMTRAVMKRFSVRAFWQDGCLAVPGRQRYQPADYAVETDYSQAAFWLTAAWLGSPLQVDGLPEGSRQGDQAIHQHLAALRTAEQTGTVCRIDAGPCPDLVPVLAVAAAATRARTEIINAARLRFKESDRLQATADALQAIGAEVTVQEDGLTIVGPAGQRCLRGGTVDGRGDHRIVMALAVAALRTQEGIVIRGTEAVSKSYPTFFNEWKRLGGQVDELNMG